MNNELHQFDVFPWNESLETGNSTIDEQHKVLVDFLNELARNLVVENEIEIDKAFAKLANYANKHFSDEEKIFEEYLLDAPCFESHKHDHDSFLTSVSELKIKLDDESYSAGIEKIMFFLLQWLVRHIIHSDKRLIIVINIIKSGKTIDEALSIAGDEIDKLEQTLMTTLVNMYNEVSSKTILLMREVEARKKAEALLNEANKELKILATVDTLTGLFNRRYFDATIPRIISKAVREKTRISFLIIDIDYFKSINDTYGHLKGDEALKLLGECLQNVCRRPDDFAFRMGGEEFCIVTSGQTEDDSIAFAQTIRKKVINLGIENKNSKVDTCMTISIGAINKVPNIGDNIDEFIRIADKRLYMAKKSGRNRVVFSE